MTEDVLQQRTCPNLALNSYLVFNLSLNELFKICIQLILINLMFPSSLFSKLQNLITFVRPNFNFVKVVIFAI